MHKRSRLIVAALLVGTVLAVAATWRGGTLSAAVLFALATVAAALAALLWLGALHIETPRLYAWVTAVLGIQLALIGLWIIRRDSVLVVAAVLASPVCAIVVRYRSFSNHRP